MEVQLSSTFTKALKKINSSFTLLVGDSVAKQPCQELLKAAIKEAKLT